MVYTYPHDMQDETPARYCDQCQGEMYNGETLYEVEGRYVCKDCFEEWARDFFETSPELFADALGVGTVTI